MEDHDERPARQTADAVRATDMAVAELKAAPNGGVDVQLPEEATETFDIEVGPLDARWFEVTRSADGSSTVKSRSLTTPTLKLRWRWLVIGLVVLAALFYRPDALPLVLKAVTGWARAG
jgi:hypothetical protein